MLRLDGRTAVISGGAGGIGSAYARLLAERGANVVVNDLPRGDGASQALVAELRSAGGTALAADADVSTADGAQAVVDAALEAYGTVDILINNAGIADTHPFGELRLENFERHWRAHVGTSILLTRAAWDPMVAQRRGRILMTVSSNGMFGRVDQADYVSAKGAVYGLTRALALEGAELGITVNAIAPFAFTPMAAAVVTDPGRRERMSRSLAPALVAPVAVWLGHDDCTVTGEVLSVGGGRVARIFVAETPGLQAGGAITPEDIAAGADAVLAESGYLVHPNGQAPVAHVLNG